MTSTLTQADLAKIDARARAHVTRAQNKFKPSPSFVKWFDVFLDEKGVNLDQMIEVESDGIFGANIMPLSAVVDAIKAAPRGEQARIKTAIVRLDFVNAPIVPFLTHLAKAIAI